MNNKVFCLGFHKTGTTSLASALRLLGYRVTGPNGVNDPDISKNALPMALRLAAKFDAFQDNPWPILYRQLDQAFPRSKFILTTRDSESWIQSQLKHFGDTSTPMRAWIYGTGCPKGNEDTYIARFEQHNREVKEYFRSRPDDLLVLDLTEGHGWNELCPFLGKATPDSRFPHANSAQNRKTNSSKTRRLVEIIKNSIDRPSSR